MSDNVHFRNPDVRIRTPVMACLEEDLKLVKNYKSMFGRPPIIANLAVISI